MLRRLARRLLPRSWHLSSFVQREIETNSREGVISGIFAGMRYVSRSSGSAWAPKVLGTYEKELSGHFSELLKTAYKTIVIVGAAEGYYAVGLALKSPNSRILAFEPSPDARELLSELASLNGVSDRVIVMSACDVPALQEALQGASPALVVMDIEGGEVILLDPRVVRELSAADIVVEVHGFAVPGVEEIILSRFRDMHDVTRVAVEARTIEDYPIRSTGLRGALSAGAAVQCLSEMRSSNSSWLVMRAKSCSR